MKECAARRLHPPRRNSVKLSWRIHLLFTYQLIKRISRAVCDKAASIFQACLLKGVVVYTCLPISKFSTKASSYSTPSGSRPEPKHAGNEPTKPCLGRTPVKGKNGNNNTEDGSL